MGYSMSIVLFLLFMMFLTMGLVFLFYEVSLYIEWVIISFNSLDLSVVFYLDWMSLMFSGVVTLISSMVMFYSMSYMAGDQHLDRFVYLVIMFIFSMVFFIFSPTLVSMMLGWDGLGLISYLLVVFYQNSSSSSAGSLTILMNRVGDLGLLFSIGWLFSYGSWNIMTFSLCGDLSFVIFFVVLAALTSSAQIPFSSWLPAAMAAPTPVSALVHSSTLVTAGVYLLIRLSWVLSDFLYVGIFLMIVSLLTMFFSGMVALFENDLKRIIALSTLSQLGLMVFIVSLGCSEIGFFHLLTHALFKSLMFLCAGSIIHDLGGLQDLRYVGGLFLFSPVMGVGFMLSNLALWGFPFLAGFYSKDMVLEGVSMGVMNLVVVIVVLVSILFTFLYSIRVMVYMVCGNFGVWRIFSLGEMDLEYVIPFVVLGGMSLIGGSVVGWLVFSEPVFYFLSVWEKLTPLCLMVVSGMLGVSFYCWGFIFSGMMVDFFLTMWYLVKLSFQWFAEWFFLGGLMSYRLVDSGWSESFSGQGGSEIIKEGFYFVFLAQQNNFKILLSFMLMLIIFLLLV